MRSRWKLWAALAATALWLGFIYARSAKPADLSHEESVSVLELLLKLFPSVSLLFVRKLAHFTEYFILGGLLYLDWRLLRRGGLWLPLAAGLLFAAGDEFLQTFIPGRSGAPLDVLLDFSGVAAAVLLALLLRRVRRRTRHGS